MTCNNRGLLEPSSTPPAALLARLSKFFYIYIQPGEGELQKTAQKRDETTRVCSSVNNTTSCGSLGYLRLCWQEGLLKQGNPSMFTKLRHGKEEQTRERPIF
jgi:hypothetical protein